MAEPLVIRIMALGDHPARRFYWVFFNNAFLLGPSFAPYADSARELLALGYDPNRRLLMRRVGVEVNQFNYTLAHAAALENEIVWNPPFFWPLQQDGPGAVP